MIQPVSQDRFDKAQLSKPSKEDFYTQTDVVLSYNRAAYDELYYLKLWPGAFKYYNRVYVVDNRPGGAFIWIWGSSGWGIDGKQLSPTIRAAAMTWVKSKIDMDIVEFIEGALG